MSILIVDDDDQIRFALKLLLDSEGLDCTTCGSPQEALHAAQARQRQLALVDLNYVDNTSSGREGLALIRALRQRDAQLPIVAMTGWGSIDVAVEAMKHGASDFIQKPWDDNERVMMAIKLNLRRQAQAGPAASVARGQSTPSRRAGCAADDTSSSSGDDDGLISVSPVMSKVLSLARRFAASALPILITGENGTGKSLLAAYIHRYSTRLRGPLISLNMGAISESAFESELFGHVRGAYTDAKQDRIGRVEMAEGGTLFMDEIANLPLTQQAKLLRLLEEGEYERLGSSQTRVADIRIISATNAELHSLVHDRSFRQDLLYRLNGVTLHLPCLRDRQADIRPLAERFLKRAQLRQGGGDKAFSAAALGALQRYPWPGNVRELRHVVERSLLIASGDQIEVDDLMLSLPAGQMHDGGPSLSSMTLEEADSWFIQHTMERVQGSANEAAKALGISRSALYRRLGKRGPR